MQGMMMNRPLRIAEIITFAEKIHPNEEIISRTLQGDIHETNYAEIASRSRRMSKALLNLGIKMGDRVATLAWNGFRHLELYFAISGILDLLMCLCARSSVGIVASLNKNNLGIVAISQTTV